MNHPQQQKPSDDSTDPVVATGTMGLLVLAVLSILFFRPAAPVLELPMMVGTMAFILISAHVSTPVRTRGWHLLETGAFLVVLGSLLGFLGSKGAIGPGLSQLGRSVVGGWVGGAVLVAGYLRWARNYLHSVPVLQRLIRECEDQEEVQLLLHGQAQQIASLQQLNEVVLDAVPMGFFLTGEGGKIVHTNASLHRVTGMLLLDLLGKKPEEAFASSPIGAVMREGMKRCHEAPFVVELTETPLVGGPAAVRLTVAFAKGGRFVFVLEDITQKVRAASAERKYQSLQLESEKLRSFSGLIAGVTRDMNDALGILLGYTELLTARPEDSDLRARAYPIMHKAVSRCRKVVTNLWEFSSERVHLKHGLSITGVLEEALELMSSRFTAAGVQVEVKLDDLPRTLGDRQQLLQVFFHLLNISYGNLVDHAGERKVVVRGFVEGSFLRISFSDSGNSLPAGLLEAEFDPFAPENEGLVEVSMTLAITRGLLHAHEGSLSREVTAGNRSHLVCELPLVHLHESAESGTGAGDLGDVFPGKKILLVDDERSILDLYSTHLADYAVEVDYCLRGEDALRKLDEKEYDLIALDINMPEINGRELYRRILDRRPGLAPRIVFLTAETTDPVIRSFLADCKAPTLFKPFTLDQLDRFLADRLTIASAVVN